MAFDNLNKKLEKPETKENIQKIGFQLMEIFNTEDIEVLAKAISFMGDRERNRLKMACERAGI
jgi:hypothetical protein